MFDCAVRHEPGLSVRQERVRRETTISVRRVKQQIVASVPWEGTGVVCTLDIFCLACC